MNRRRLDHLLDGAFEPLPRVGVKLYALFLWSGWSGGLAHASTVVATMALRNMHNIVENIEST
jgi:hypothetical protein